MKQAAPFPSYRFSVAPMLDVTDRHARYFYRSLSQHTLLYTEMITTGAILHGHGGYERFLQYNEEEHPVALQLGGSDPKALAECTKIANTFGYDEINLNVGCPSDRVQSGRFGACLMAEPQLVADCISAMRDVSDVPVTIKCRLGIDQDESYELFERFISITAESCDHFIVHARKAWLDGLSPKENRHIPPLRYEWVYRIKQERPDLIIAINGGIHSMQECLEHLEHVDGVMLGREIQQNPMFLANVDEKIFGADAKAVDNIQHLYSLLPYIEKELSKGTPLQAMTKHLVTFLKGLPGAKLFRRHISENAHKKGADINVIDTALKLAQAEIDKRAEASL